MNYLKLKQKLYDAKIRVEKTSDYIFEDKELDKNIITKDFVQYFIFIQELENKIKKDDSIKISDFSQQLSLINRYIDVVNEKLNQ